jgi:O-antigen/teichoic acid export membrane protein
MSTVISKIRWILQGQNSTSATLQTFLTKIFILGINVATGMITARVLGPDGRGEQAAIILWSQFLASVIYNLKRYPKNKSQLLTASLILSLVLGSVAMLVGIVLIPHWLAHYSVETIRMAQWFMLLAPLAMLSITITAALEAQEQFTISNHGRYLVPLFTLLLLLGFTITENLNPVTAGLAYVIPSVPVTFWMLGAVWKTFRWQWSKLRTAYQHLLSYGIRSYGIDLLGTLSGQIDQALVIGLLDAKSMGIYAVALSLSRMLSVIQSSIVTVLLPKTAARPIPEIADTIAQATRVSTMLSLPLTAIVMLFSPILLQLLYGTKFLDAVFIFRILVIEQLVSCAVWILAQAFMAAGRPGTVALLQGVGLGVSFPLMLILIPKFGLVGAATALLCSTLLRMIFVLVSFPMILNVSIPRLICDRRDWQFVQQLLQRG